MLRLFVWQSATEPFPKPVGWRLGMQSLKDFEFFPFWLRQSFSIYSGGGHPFASLLTLISGHSQFLLQPKNLIN